MRLHSTSRASGRMQPRTHIYRDFNVHEQVEDEAREGASRREKTERGLQSLGAPTLHAEKILASLKKQKLRHPPPILIPLPEAVMQLHVAERIPIDT